jgi:hypothetical protein
LADLPRPLTAVLVGGPTGHYRYRREDAEDLLENAIDLAHGGSLFISTSRRTPSDLLENLKARLPANSRLHEWAPNQNENPYLALLGLADRFVVTGDSISMMVEVARMGKPMYIYLPTEQKPIWRRLLDNTKARLHNDGSKSPDRRLWSVVGTALYKLGLVSYSRDLSVVHHALVKTGCAKFFGNHGSRMHDETCAPGVIDPLDDVINRIVQLES